MLSGHRHCGAIRYQVHTEPKWTALCHCGDRRRHAGAPVVGWAAIPEDGLKVIKGQPKVYCSSEPDAIAPQIQVQTAERLAWMEGAQKLPTFEPYSSRG